MKCQGGAVTGGGISGQGSLDGMAFKEMDMSNHNNLFISYEVVGPVLLLFISMALRGLQ